MNFSSQSVSFFGLNPLAFAVRLEPFLFLTEESLPQGTMVLLPGCLIVSSSDVKKISTSQVVNEQSMPKLTSLHLHPDMESALEELLSSVPMDRV